MVRRGKQLLVLEGNSEAHKQPSTSNQKTKTPRETSWAALWTAGLTMGRRYELRGVFRILRDLKMVEDSDGLV
jgi:hypothetical protein